uniref:Uncharacterized protein n=1 Tax=Molossus molossus TaxID=27622 RepID=A0A7J8E0U0_MOLMO|nr:hypothetical protein HJG59_001862 [Molossus molossus]
MAKVRGAETLFFVLFLDCWQGSPQPESLKNSEFESGSNKQEDYLARLFNEIVLQVYSNVSSDEARTTEKSITKRAMKESHVFGEERKEPSLFNRAIQDNSALEDKEAAKPDAQNKTVPCVQLLHFLQRNNLIAMGVVSAVLVATVLLLLLLTVYIRRKQALPLPANMTYNIFIMSGKTWWQKYQEKNSKNNAGKQKRLNCDSCA